MIKCSGLGAFGASASGDQAPSQGASGAQCWDRTEIPLWAPSAPYFKAPPAPNGEET